MKCIYRTLIGVLSIACASSAFAQQAGTAAASSSTTTSPAPSAVAPAPAVHAVLLSDPTPNVLRAGTPIALKMSEGLTTEKKKLRTGQRFQMEVAEPVLVNGQVVIPAGSPAVGEVTQVRNKGMWGKSGYIGAQALFVRANGRQIRLTGQFDDKGVTGTAGVVAAIALVPVVGFFTTGTSARIPMGSGIKAFIDEDVEVAFAPAAANSPMTVPAAPASASPPPAIAPVAAAAAVSGGK